MEPDKHTVDLSLQAYKPRGTLVDVGHRFFDLPHRQYMAHCTELFKRYAIQIVHAVAGIHSKGIMHRDIKPDNILVDERGDLFLSDFGFAKEFTTRTPEHHVSWDHRSVPTISVRLARLSQLPCGTPGFMAPEMLVNNPQGDRWYGFEADWYSVGATLYELFVGPGEVCCISYLESARPSRCSLVFSCHIFPSMKKYLKTLLQRTNIL